MSQTPILSGEHSPVTDATQPAPAGYSQELINLMASCPHSWQGDEGFMQWCKKVYSAGAAPAPPALAISALDPATLTAGATNVKLTVAATGLSEGAIVVAGGQDQTTTLGASAYLADALVAAAGTVAVQVRNADGTLSNTLELTVS